MKLKSLIILLVLIIQPSCRLGNKSLNSQLTDSSRETLLAKILKAEDSRNEQQLIELRKTIGDSQPDIIARLAIAAGRVPSFEVWKSLAVECKTNRNVAEALAIAVRFPDTGFASEEVFRILQTFPPSKTLVETFLFLNLKKAFDYALSLNQYQDIVASNLWRSKDFVTEGILRKFYAITPEATVYSIYRTRTKGIVKISDLPGMALENRYYGCLVSDYPEEFFMDPDWQVRVAVVKNSTTPDTAKKLLSDPAPLVRAAAFQVYLEKNGPAEIFSIEKLNAMEAEILCPYIKDESTIQRIFERRGHFSEIAAPYLGKQDRDKVLSSHLSDRTKVRYLEKQFGRDQAIIYARKLFMDRGSSAGLQYLLEQEEGVEKIKIVELAKSRGRFTSELQDFGFLKPEPASLSLQAYADILKTIKKYQGFEIETDRGLITCSFFQLEAPLTCFNFIELAKKKYFDGSYFHRVIPAFVAQDGDPTGTGSGGPGYTIRCEYNALKYDRAGQVGMALAGKDTGGSQFFMTHLPAPHLNHQYTIFARIVKGLVVLSEICQYDRIRQIRLI